MPKRINPEDDMPRRRRGASAVAIEAGEERNLTMRILHSPKDLIAGALAFAAVSAIIANAMFMQAGHHPSPMFGAAIPVAVSAPASPLPRPRPAEATLKPADVKLAEVPAEVKPAAVSVAGIGIFACSSIGPVSSPGSICMMVTAVSASRASSARSIGAAPRQRGSSEA